MAPAVHIPLIMIRSKSAINSGLIRACFRAAMILALSAAPAFAQGRPMPIKAKLTPPKGKLAIPPGFAPPTGMCRIWIEGVPADQQPAPTDCASAVKNRPLNGRVIFSEEKATPPKTSKKKSDEESSI
jgi:hypothetical protein